jgi:hypothetical protein
MEEYLTRPPPTMSDIQEEGLPIDYNQKTLEFALAKIGTLTSPANGDDFATIIQWQAAHLLNKIDPDVLKGLLSKLPGASSKIGEIPIIKSYTNLLLLLTEEDSGKKWITRVPYGQEDQRFLIDQVESLLRVRKRFTGFRVPKLYHYGLAGDETNKLAIDYMLLDFIDGEQMPMWTETHPTWEQKEQILDQLADTYMEIFSKPVSFEDRLELRSMWRVRFRYACTNLY